MFDHRSAPHRIATACTMKMAFVVAVAAGAIGAIGAGCGASPSPTPAVAFAVGLSARTFIDTSRTTPANGTEPMLPARTLPTEIWYPATGDATNPDPIRNAPLFTAAQPFPLVLFVHGSEGSNMQSTFLTGGLAAAGFVVAAADFPLTASTTLGGSSDLHCDDQQGDLSFLADQFAAIAADATDPLALAIDPQAGYSIVGHSTGGTIALLSAFGPDPHDARVKAAIALAPCACFFGDSFFTTRAVPLLVMGGTDDLLVPLPSNGARAYALSGTPKVFATIVGGTHIFFTDFNIPDADLDPSPTTTDADIAKALIKDGGGTACTPIPAPSSDPIIAPDDQRNATVALVTAFLLDHVESQPTQLANLEAQPPAHLVIEHE